MYLKNKFYCNLFYLILFCKLNKILLIYLIYLLAFVNESKT